MQRFQHEQLNHYILFHNLFHIADHHVWVLGAGTVQFCADSLFWIADSACHARRPGRQPHRVTGNVDPV